MKAGHLRKKRSANAIENIPGIGYRLSPEQYDAVRCTEAAPSGKKSLAAE